MNDLGPDVAQFLLSNLGAVDLARCSRLSRYWHKIATNDALWKEQCIVDYGIRSKNLILPGGEQLNAASFKQVWECCRVHFGCYGEYFKRARVVWDRIEQWLEKNAPFIRQTLAAGATEEEFHEAEKLYGRLPQALRAIYAIHNGQNLQFDENLRRHGTFEMHPSLFYGLFGGYSFYEVAVNVRFLPIHVGAALSGPPTKKLMFACSFNQQRKFRLNLECGAVEIERPRGFVSCCPDDGSGRHDWDLIRWFEAFADQLTDDYFRVSQIIPDFEDSIGICRFPEKGPALSEAITRGVKVRVSSIFIAEFPRDEFAYSVRLSLMDAADISCCQLMSRHWAIASGNGNRVEHVRGEGVIGLYPILRPNEREFRYQSRTEVSGGRGSMEGEFQMIVGTIQENTGETFDAKIAPFALFIPDYIF